MTSSAVQIIPSVFLLAGKYIFCLLNLIRSSSFHLGSCDGCVKTSMCHYHNHHNTTYFFIPGIVTDQRIVWTEATNHLFVIIIILIIIIKLLVTIIIKLIQLILHNFRYCDGSTDCIEGSEIIIITIKLIISIRQYSILHNFRYCDGSTDCIDGSDEPSSCPTPPCRPGQFRCLHSGGADA